MGTRFKSAASVVVFIAGFLVFACGGGPERAAKLEKLMNDPAAFEKEFKAGDVKLLDFRDRNLLEIAVDGGSPRVTAFLVRKGMDPMGASKAYNFNAYQSALGSKQGLEHVKAMLDAKPALKKDAGLMAASLGRATARGNTKVVEYFLKLGVPVSTIWKDSDDDAPLSLLHLALRAKVKLPDKAKIAKFLLKAGADANSTQAPKKRTPLFYAVNSDDKGTLPDLLARSGASLKARDADGIPLMAWYSLKKEYGMIRYLLRKGVRPPAILLVPRTESRTTSKTVKERIYNPNSRLPSSYRTENRTVYKTEYYKKNIPICDSVFRNTYPDLCRALARAGYKLPR